MQTITANNNGYMMIRLPYPENTDLGCFLMYFVVSAGKVCGIAFACSDCMAQWNFENWDREYWWKSKGFCQHFQVI